MLSLVAIGLGVLASCPCCLASDEYAPCRNFQPFKFHVALFPVEPCKLETSFFGFWKLPGPEAVALLKQLVPCLPLLNG
jgi:hypothetical protein